MEPSFGPKMAALPDRWQKFVIAYLSQGRRNAENAARVAGFSSKSDGYLKVQGHRLLHDVRIQDALIEESRRMLVALAPSAIWTTEEIMTNPQATGAERLTAAKMVMDRTGLHGMTEHKSTVEYVGDDPEQMKRIAMMAQVLGLPIEQLLGRRLALQAPTIDQEPEHVEVDGERY